MDNLTNYLTGQCQDMCPFEEMRMREKERLLHMLEVVPGTKTDRMPKADKSRVVKSFCRSAVGKTMQNPKNIRPPDVLLKTINYLLDEVVSREDVPWVVIYDFVMDRLRSVRQDLVIQNASAVYCISILQPIIRFHAYASYRLCEETVNNFDPVINNTHLQECLKRLLCMYNSYDQPHKKDIAETSQYLIENRPHFEALYLVLNLGNVEAITRALNLPGIWKTDVVEMALELSLCYRNNNFVRVCRIIEQLPKLLLAVAASHLQKLRRSALRVMSVAYNSKNLSLPVCVVKDVLLYNDEQHTINDCKYYGLEVRESSICFLKTSFNENKKVLPPKREGFVDERLNDVNISTLILYGD